MDLKLNFLRINMIIVKIAKFKIKLIYIKESVIKMRKKSGLRKKMLVIFLIACLLSTQLTAPTSTFAEPEYNFAKALQLSMYFYDANKCGPGISGGRLEWRGDCDLQDLEVPLKPMGEDFTGTTMSQTFIDKYRNVLDPDGDGTLDLHGGMHDAGDHVKFGLPQTYAASTLGWGFYEFRDAYIKIGEEEHIKDILRWFNDYFLRSTFRDEDGNVIAFCYQVGEGNIDHNYWSPPELQRFARPAYFATEETPASDQCAGAAASLAINYLNYKDEDPLYADQCLDTAKALYEFAKKYRGLGYSGGFYGSSYDHDEMAWAAVWLNIATGEKQYIDDITATDANGQYIGYFKRIMTNVQDMWQNIWVHCWDTVWGGVFAKLAPVTNTERDWYIFRWNLEYWSGIPHEDPKDTAFLSKTPAGFSVVNPYGSARYNTAAQLCALVYKKYSGRSDFAEWAKNQMEYIMGNNPMDRCYIVGYAPNSARHPHHRAAHGSKTLSMDDPPEHRHTLWGALVGGPDLTDKHVDVTSDYVYNEVAIDYNAAFVGAVAGLYTYYGEGHQPVPNFPPKEPPVDEYFAQAKLEQENNERTQITLRIHNESVHPPHFEKGMKVRYFFNISELLDAGQTIDDVELQVMYDENLHSYSGPVASKGPVKWDEAGTYYVEFDWSGYDIYGTREFQFALVAGQDSNFKSNWNASNDWGRQGVTKDYATSSYIPVYLGDQLVYGSEPLPVSPTPTPTIDPNISPTPSPIEPPSLKVLYKCGETDSATNTVRAAIKIQNTGTRPLNLANIKLRYWFTRDSEEIPAFETDYVQLGSSKVAGTFGNITPGVSNADSFVEIRFNADAGSIAPGADTGEIQFKFFKEGYISYNQVNDYSFEPALKEFAENRKITAYANSALCYGLEPEGIGPLPSPTPLFIYGDINGDNLVNSTDYTLLKRYLLKIIDLFPSPDGSSPYGQGAADVSGDGLVNSTDLTLIKRYLLKIITVFPAEN